MERSGCSRGLNLDLMAAGSVISIGMVNCTSFAKIPPPIFSMHGKSYSTPHTYIRNFAIIRKNELYNHYHTCKS